MIDLPPDNVDILEWLFKGDKKKIKRAKRATRWSQRHSQFSGLDKEYYHTKEYLDLVNEFIYCYSYLCSQGVIKLKEKNGWSNVETKYDMDVVTLIYLLKQMHLLRGKNIGYNKWILVWGFAFDKDFLKHSETRLWEQKYWKYLDSQHLPSDYVKFFETGDLKYLEKNSFNKYKKNITILRFLEFLFYLLDDVDTYYGIDMSYKDRKIGEVRENAIDLFYYGFKNLLTILNINEKENVYYIKGHAIKDSMFNTIVDKVDKSNANRCVKSLKYLCEKYPKQLTKELFGVAYDRKK